MQEGIDNVKCQICGLEFGTLCRHLGVHGIDADEYVRRYPGAKVIADKIRDGRSAKLRAKPKKGDRLTCKYCGGKFEGRVQRRAHERREESVYLAGEQGKSFVVCLECGFRESRISLHVSGQHGMTVEEYRVKHPDAPVEVQSLIEKQNATKRAKGGYKPISERRLSQQCKTCGDWYVFGGQERHLRECLVAHPDAYLEGRDYVKCPECCEIFLLLGKHLKQVHGWDANRLAVETGRGLKLTSQLLANKRNAKRDFKAIQEKREQTHLERHGHKNPFSDPAIQEKIVETSQRRYGTDHPMQNEEVRIRQNESAMNGPSGQEVFFMEHVVSPNVVYVGFGGRFIRTKTGVRKYGRVIKDLNPDFMVLPDNVLESAISASKERRKLSSERHRTKYVIELLGDYYHSEKIIGVPPAEHEKEVVDAYKSAGIECLALWEHDVLGRWNEIEPRVSEWIQKAVADINANPVWRKPTKSKVDGRLANLPCPFGSGKVFRSQAKLDKWVSSPLNFWRPEMVEGKDYVKCLECENVRVGKVAEHLRTMHGGMTKEQYLEKHPGALLVASRVSEMVVSHAAGRVGQNHVPRIAYRCPDGSFVRKNDAWKRAWADQPPADSIVDASTVDLDPWAGKVEGVDYVVCRCGYKAANLTQHLRRQHGGLDGHNGPVKSQGCIKALQEAAKKTWDTRGRKPAIENPQTHKRHGLTMEILEQLYSADGLSDAKIGERYGMTGEGIAYQRKKFGIETRKRILEKIQQP